ncbi:MAG: hypothetical protein JKY43_05440 [Phycisphaerales bacterium]|nr:hypothetical protein [Phycisphaerales bacterium]
MATNKPKARSRKVLWIIAGLSILTGLFSSYALAQRIHNFNAERDAPLYSFIDIQLESFDMYGHPFSIEEITLDNNPYLKILWADQELIIPVAIPPRHELPTLFDRQVDWLSMMLLADRSGMSLKELESKIISGQITPRLMIATRTPFGAEPTKEKHFDSIEHKEDWAWGESRRDLWRFNFYEMNQDGSITTHQPLRFPESGKSLERRQNNAKLKGEPIPQRDPGEIVEYTWQYGAALKVSPRAPAITFENQALRAAGWTLPTAAASILTLIASVFFAIAPARVTE